MCRTWRGFIDKGNILLFLKTTIRHEIESKGTLNKDWIPHCTRDMEHTKYGMSGLFGEALFWLSINSGFAYTKWKSISRACRLWNEPNLSTKTTRIFQGNISSFSCTIICQLYLLEMFSIVAHRMQWPTLWNINYNAQLNPKLSPWECFPKLRCGWGNFWTSSYCPIYPIIRFMGTRAFSFKFCCHMIYIKTN